MYWKSRLTLIALLMTTLFVGCQSENHSPKAHMEIAQVDVEQAEPDLKDNEIPSETSSETSSYDYLKIFEWLVGDWKDDSDDVNITYKYEWDENKNFLKQHFSVILGEDEVDLHGIQVFGWDPIKKQIRSWIFDSDGGFGESFWSKVNGKWYATTTYVLPDGTKASAVHVFKKINDSAYSFSSESRELGGEMLPDAGPFTIVRQKEVGTDEKVN